MELKPNGKAGFTKSQVEWLGQQSAARSDGSFDEHFDKMQTKAEEALRTAREQAIAEHGFLQYDTAFKDERGNEKAIIEIDLDRVELEVLLGRAEQDYATQREKAISMDGQNVNVLDGSDPGAYKDMIFNHQMHDMAVTGGIIDAIKPHITDQK